MKSVKASKAENRMLKETLLNLNTYIQRENLKFCIIAEEKGDSALQCCKKVLDLFTENELSMEKMSPIGCPIEKMVSTEILLPAFYGSVIGRKYRAQRTKLSGSSIYQRG